MKRIANIAISASLLTGVAFAIPQEPYPPTRQAPEQLVETNEGTSGADRFLEQQGANELTWDNLEGKTVVNADGTKAGEIADLIIDEDGQVSGVILLVGGFLGIGGKPVGLAWDDIEIHGQEVALVELSQEDLLAAPRYKDRAALEREAAMSTVPQENTLGMTTPPTTSPQTGSEEQGVY